MWCCELFLDIGAEALRLVGTLLGGKGVQNPSGYNPLKQADYNKVGDDGGLKDSICAAIATADRRKECDELQHNIVVNPRFCDGTTGWFGVGCSLSVGSYHGSSYCIAQGRTEKRQGLAQEIGYRLEADVDYWVEAWVGMRGGRAEQAQVQATVQLEKTQGGGDEYILLSSVTVEKGQWSLLTGTLRVQQPENATLYFDGPLGGIDILVSSVAIVPTSTTAPSTKDDKKKIVNLRSEPSFLKDREFEVNIIENTNLTKGADGLEGWYAMGGSKLSVRSGGPTDVGVTLKKSFVHTPAPKLSGNYIYCSNRTETFEGPAQDITGEIQLFESYQVFAWVATIVPPGSNLKVGPQKVDISLEIDGEWNQGGEVLAGDHWTEVSGAFRLESRPKKVVVYLQGPDPGVDVMLGGLHIFAVDRLGRIPVLQRRADEVRKRDVIVKLRDSQGLLPAGTRVSVEQTKNSFPIGTCIKYDSLTEDHVYRNFFLDHFNWAVFKNELKWDQVEPEEGNIYYKEVDDMARFCDENKIPMRGHCIVWEDEEFAPEWVQDLEGDELVEAVQKRIIGLLSRYKGRFQHYDVNNEILHGDFYEDKLGADFLPYMFRLAHETDPHAALFTNDYDVANGADCGSSPEKYVDLIRYLQSKGAPVGGIGLQGHIDVPVGPILGRAMDVLSVLNLPIWFTEVDVASVREDIRADDLEVLFREAFAHPAVGGCVLWGFMENAMDKDDAQLLDEDSRLTVAGRRFLQLKNEWKTDFQGVVDANGELVFRGFFGTYNISVDGRGVHQTFEVAQGDESTVLEISI